MVAIRRRWERTAIHLVFMCTVVSMIMTFQFRNNYITRNVDAKQEYAPLIFKDKGIEYKRNFQINESIVIGETSTKVLNKRHNLYYNTTRPPQLFTTWRNLKVEQCNGKFISYGEFAHIKDVIVDKSKFQGRAGGEEIEQVINQAEKDEYYKYKPGCFQLTCDRDVTYSFNKGFHLTDYVKNVKTTNVSTSDFETKISKFTIVVTRYEYVNLYHTMTDWYNAFLLMKFFNKTQAETSILFIDCHPQGVLDHTWTVLFDSANRLSSLKTKTMYENLVWNIVGYNSVLLKHNSKFIPLTEEFRDFFLNGFNITKTKTLSCNKLNILFIWRRNYLAHPRNPNGTVSRKISNEQELLNATKKLYKHHEINGVQIDLLSMKKQLQLISETDILIGMHGAGLTHAMFLPKHAGLIELFPIYWSNMDHFKSIARWRGLTYERWTNRDRHLEISGKRTKIPPTVVATLLKRVIAKMQCSMPSR